jgi:hypothetical protein
MLSQRYSAKYSIAMTTFAGEFNCADDGRGIVLVDGLRRRYITRGYEGVDGWVEQHVRDASGRPVLRDGKLVSRIIRGAVVVIPTHFSRLALRKLVRSEELLAALEYRESMVDGWHKRYLLD